MNILLAAFYAPGIRAVEYLLHRDLALVRTSLVS